MASLTPLRPTYGVSDTTFPPLSSLEQNNIPSPQGDTKKTPFERFNHRTAKPLFPATSIGATPSTRFSRGSHATPFKQGPRPLRLQPKAQYLYRCMNPSWGNIPAFQPVTPAPQLDQEINGPTHQVPDYCLSSDNQRTATNQPTHQHCESQSIHSRLITPHASRYIPWDSTFSTSPHWH
eukprot:gb/GEZN01017351.1/.p1 GENE.gb/GEZN01017351.1/~~gb/GEZN01017351.1/.p1  ORF type:complete len:179 (+),score=10.67 gb/GEZN01017351.1/:178-714(+)